MNDATGTGLTEETLRRADGAHVRWEREVSDAPAELAGCVGSAEDGLVARKDDRRQQSTFWAGSGQRIGFTGECQQGVRTLLELATRVALYGLNVLGGSPTRNSHSPVRPKTDLPRRFLTESSGAEYLCDMQVRDVRR